MECDGERVRKRECDNMRNGVVQGNDSNSKNHAHEKQEEINEHCIRAPKCKGEADVL